MSTPSELIERLDTTPYSGYTVRTGLEGEWDCSIIEEVRAVYFWEEIDWKSCRYAVDVGAHIGAWTMTCKQRYAPHMHIVAVEPHPVNFSLLTRNTADTHHVLRVHGAIMGHSGYTYVQEVSDNTGGHYTSDDREGIPVQALTLDELVDKGYLPCIDVLKLDCEGAEFEILASMSDELLAKTRYIVGEYHGKMENVMRFMERTLEATHHIPILVPTDTLLGIFVAKRIGLEDERPG